MRLIKNILPFGISCLIATALFQACSNDNETQLGSIYSCDQVEELTSLIDSLNNNNDFIVNYNFRHSAFEFDFYDHKTIYIEPDCIKRIKEIKDKSSLIIYTAIGSKIHVNFKNAVQINYQHDPNGRTSLSGLLILNARVPGILEYGLEPKDPGHERFEYSFKDQSNTFEKAILGLYFDHRNTIEIHFHNGIETFFRDTIMVETVSAYPFLPSITVDEFQKEKVEPGMNLVSFLPEVPSSPFIVDNYGEFRYILDFSNHPELSDLNYDVGIERLENGNFYFGKLLSSKIYEIDLLGSIVNTWDISPYEFHHNVQETNHGTLLATVSKYNIHATGNRAIEDCIIEIDRNSGNIINEWDLKESMDENRDVLGWWTWSDLVDWAHVNAVIPDPRDNSIIVSCRTQGLVKLDYDNNIKWVLGNHKGWSNNRRGEDLETYLLQPLDGTGNIIEESAVLEGLENHDDFEWPWYQHAPLITKNGNLLLFDNGDLRNFSANSTYSRAVEYEIDEINMTVQQVWQYGKERSSETYSKIVSDVDQLAQTGNIYFCPGSRVNNGNGQFGAKLIELDYDSKEVLFEMRINSDNIVFHRAERIDLYPDSY